MGARSELGFQAKALSLALVTGNITSTLSYLPRVSSGGEPGIHKKRLLLLHEALSSLQGLVRASCVSPLMALRGE